MRTRRGISYPTSLSQHNNVNQQSSLLPSLLKTQTHINATINSSSSTNSEPSHRCRKRPRKSYLHGGTAASATEMFDCLPDDLVILILSKLGASASCPCDFINVLITCKRLNKLSLHSQVLSKASEKIFAMKAKNWSDSAHKFFKLCADSGNNDACFTLGMIRFYCLENRASGMALMAKAAINSHTEALYSLAIIQFNGSGGSKSNKNLCTGVALCARAASLGHIDALRELGHCLQDGYGVRQNVIEGRRLLIQANARELAYSLAPSKHICVACNVNARRTLLSDFGCDMGVLREMDRTSRFLREWFEIRGRVTMCSYKGCGRPETRKHEFRRCSVCGDVNYCSRACQALDWKLRHKAECRTAPAVVPEIGINHDGQLT